MFESVLLNGVFIFAVLGVFLVAGMWIPAALALSALSYLILANGFESINMVGNLLYNNVNSFTLTAVPMFILMGELILRSNFMGPFYQALAHWLRPLRGGLLHSNIGASGILSAVTGSSVATAAAIGSVAIPEMKAAGYKKEKIYGSIAAGGTLGILIPPSIIMIVYGSLAQESVAVLFIASITPGILAVILFMLFIAASTKKNEGGQQALDLSENIWGLRIKGLVHIVPILLLMAVVIGFIYLGVMSPSEAGAVGAVAAIVMIGLYRRLKVSVLRTAVERTVRLSCMVLFIVMSAALYSYALVDAGVTRQLSSWVSDMGLGVWPLLIVISIIILILGMFIDGISIVYLTIPLLLPILIDFEIDLVWFGVILVLLIEIGLITPTMGLNLFIIKSLDNTASLRDVVVGTFPYVIMMLLLVVLVMAFPALALWLPTIGMG